MDFPPAFALACDPAAPAPPAEPSLCDSITSLMNMADKMEALLPPELDLTSHLDPARARSFADAVSSVTLPTPPLDAWFPPTLYTAPPPAPATTSPVSIRDPPFPAAPPRPVLPLPCRLSRAAVAKPARPKPARKPKTYSKPVASRFCHICSRMPRRGHGAATCRRMAEGFCRKIVCEQCLREQGWDYDHVAANPGAWLCPHCDNACPPRSQCHIYNRINARRKRAGKAAAAAAAAAASQGNTANGAASPTVAAALASSDALLGPYGHLLGSGVGRKVQEHILQPPPNFRLNLPPQYSQQ